MTFDPERDYFPQPRETVATRPADDAPTMADAVAYVLLDVHLLWAKP